MLLNAALVSLILIAGHPVEGRTNAGQFPYLPSGICYSDGDKKEYLRRNPDCPVCIFTSDIGKSMEMPFRVWSWDLLKSSNVVAGRNLISFLCNYSA